MARPSGLSRDIERFMAGGGDEPLKTFFAPARLALKCNGVNGAFPTAEAVGWDTKSCGLHAQ